MGKVSVTLDSSTLILKKGEGITVPVGAIHRIKGIEDSVILEIAFGEFDESDIIRLDDDFGRIGSRVRRNRMNKEVQGPITKTGNNSGAQSPIPVKVNTLQVSDMIRICNEEENIERRLEILRKINALLPDEQRLNIPSLITVQYIDHALSDIEERILQIL